MFYADFGPTLACENLIDCHHMALIGSTDDACANAHRSPAASVGSKAAAGLALP
jgi:hypothetical protein